MKSKYKSAQGNDKVCYGAKYDSIVRCDASSGKIRQGLNWSKLLCTNKIHNHQITTWFW